MSMHWQNDSGEYRAHGDGETPVAEVDRQRPPDTSSHDRAEMRDEAHHRLREIAQGFCYIGIARWSRDAAAVRANLHGALEVLRNIDAHRPDGHSADPGWRKVQTASDHLRNRLMEAFSNLLDQVVHELPRHGRISKRARDDEEAGMQCNPSEREGARGEEADPSAFSAAEEDCRDDLGGTCSGGGPSSGPARAEEDRMSSDAKGN